MEIILNVDGGTEEFSLISWQQLKGKMAGYCPSQNFKCSYLDEDGEKIEINDEYDLEIFMKNYKYFKMVPELLVDWIQTDDIKSNKERKCAQSTRQNEVKAQLEKLKKSTKGTKISPLSTTKTHYENLLGEMGSLEKEMLQCQTGAQFKNLQACYQQMETEFRLLMKLRIKQVEQRWLSNMEQTKSQSKASRPIEPPKPVDKTLLYNIKLDLSESQLDEQFKLEIKQKKAIRKQLKKQKRKLSSNSNPPQVRQGHALDNSFENVNEISFSSDSFEEHSERLPIKQVGVPDDTFETIVMMNQMI